MNDVKIQTELGNVTRTEVKTHTDFYLNASVLNFENNLGKTTYTAGVFREDLERLLKTPLFHRLIINQSERISYESSDSFNMNESINYNSENIFQLIVYVLIFSAISISIFFSKLP